MQRRPLIAPALRRLFRAIAHTTLASSCFAACAEEAPVKDTDAPVATDAASANHSPGETGWSQTEGESADDGGSDATSETAFERIPCPWGTVLPRGELKTPTPISAVGIYTQTYAPGAPWLGGNPPFTVSDRARSGVMCAGAADSAACEKELSRLAAEPGGTLPFQIAIAMEQSVLRRVASRAELLRVFGAIDTGAEAVLLSSFDGYRLCPASPTDTLDRDAEMRATPSGYELRVTHEGGGCNNKDLWRTLLHVDAAGNLAVVSVEMLRGSLACPVR